MSRDVSGDDVRDSAVFDLIARASQMGESGKFIVLITDPEVSPGMSAYGPFDGPQAAEVAEAIRADFATTADMSPGDDATNCTIDIVPWNDWT